MIKKLTTTIILSIFSFAMLVPAYAQMTDEEVTSYTKTAISSGKSSEQVAKDLLAKGVTPEQIKRIQSSSNGSVTGTTSFDTEKGKVGGQERLRRNVSIVNQSKSSLDEVANLMTADSIKVSSESAKATTDMGTAATTTLSTAVSLESLVYGHSIFKQSNLTFAPNQNVATPENYKLGPGDEVFIDIWGANQATIRQTISPDGFIVVDNIGMLSLNGMKLKEAEKYLRRQLAKIYSFDGDEPKSDMKLSLGAIRTINVNVVGEVAYPGTYQVSSLSSVYHALYLAGGFSSLGSVRKISLIRNGKEVKTVDVYDFLLNGKSSDDVKLQEGDNIVVPTYDNIVTVEGNVKRPMLYEMLEGETVEKLLQYAGGFKGDAYTSNVNIIRNNGKELQVNTVLAADFANVTVKDGDILRAHKILDRYENRIEVVGAVYRPGIYELSPEINTVKKLIEIADGLKGDAFTNRAIIRREKSDYTLETVSFDLQELLDGNLEDIELKNNDVLYISSVHDLRDMGEITVKGEVALPGTYVYAENTTIEDAIILAGGLLESATIAKVEVSRRIKNIASTSVTDTLSYSFTYTIKDGFVVGGDEVVLQPYDVVYVRKSPSYSSQVHATISGEVVYPGMYALTEKDFRLSDLVNAAGGTTKWSYIAGAKLVRTMTEEEKKLVKATLKALEDVDEGIAEDLNGNVSEYTVGINLALALEEPGSDHDVVLREGDKLIIPEYTNTVKISGNVMYPNVVSYNPSMNVREFITMAGGYGNEAKKGRAYVIYMNGTVSKARGSSKKVIQPGCEIIVPARVKNEDLLPTIMSFVSATSSSASLLTTLYALVRTLNR